VAGTNASFLDALNVLFIAKEGNKEMRNHDERKRRREEETNEGEEKGRNKW
jgi:hypothetical protein